MMGWNPREDAPGSLALPVRRGAWFLAAVGHRATWPRSAIHESPGAEAPGHREEI